MIDDAIDERGAAAESLQLLENCLKGILNDEQVLRQSFDDATRDFIRHERRQIEIENGALSCNSFHIGPRGLGDT